MPVVFPPWPGFSYLQDFELDQKIYTHTAFVGLFREEYDAIKYPKTDEDVVDGVLKGALNRLAEQWKSLTVDNFNVGQVILRHLDSLAESEAILHPSFMGTIYSLAEQPISELVIEDLHIPVAAFQPLDQCYVTKLLRGDSLQDLALLEVTAPWSVFTCLPSLIALNVESVKVTEFSQESSLPVSTPRQGLTKLRWRNSTDLVSKLICNERAHRLRFNHLIDLDCDMGSTQSFEWARRLIQRNQGSLQLLTIEFEGNADDECPLVPPDNTFITSLRLPNLTFLTIVDTYDITDVSPLSDDTLLWPRMLPTLGPGRRVSTTLVVKKLPVLSPELYICYSPSFPHAIHAILKMTLDAIDSGLCDLDCEWLRLCFTPRTGVNTPDAWTARRELEMNHPEATFAMSVPPDDSNPSDGYPSFCSLMDQLNNVSGEFRSMLDYDEEAFYIAQAFQSFYLPKLNARNQEHLVNLVTS